MELSTDNFPVEELRCHCPACQGGYPHQIGLDALEALQRVRDRFGKPMVLTSAYRCRRHPEEARKPQPGRHNQGLAFDVLIPWGRDRMRLVKIALEEGFRGFGFANTFLHIDFRPEELTSWPY